MIGITCDDSDPSGIVSFSVRRDATLTSEDHLRVVLGPFLDGRSGYVFSVNPGGARYDGLITPGGETENADWDGIWEAATTRTAAGWTAAIWIPVQTLSFNPSLREWHFNVLLRSRKAEPWRVGCGSQTLKPSCPRSTYVITIPSASTLRRDDVVRQGQCVGCS